MHTSRTTYLLFSLFVFAVFVSVTVFTATGMADGWAAGTAGLVLPGLDADVAMHPALLLGGATVLLGVLVAVSLRLVFLQARKNAELAGRLEDERGRDPQTGLPSRARFVEELEAEVGRSARYAERLCLILLDIDGLKMINEFYGRAAGDLAIRIVRDVLAAEIRTVDSVYSFGGGQFGIVLPSTDVSGGFVLADRLRAALEAVVVPWEDERELSLTVSCGLIVAGEDPGESADLILDRAETCLSRAKRCGRIRVC